MLACRGAIRKQSVPLVNSNKNNRGLRDAGRKSHQRTLRLSWRSRDRSTYWAIIGLYFASSPEDACQRASALNFSFSPSQVLAIAARCPFSLPFCSRRSALLVSNTTPTVQCRIALSLRRRAIPVPPSPPRVPSSPPRSPVRPLVICRCRQPPTAGPLARLPALNSPCHSSRMSSSRRTRLGRVPK